MKKLLKWLGASIGIIVVAFIIATVALTLFVNPNQFKPIIVSQFKQYTGYDIAIPGNLSWSFFPRLGIETDEVDINNPAVFSSKMKNVVLQVKFGPLFRREFELSNVSIGQILFNQLEASDIKAHIWFKDKILEVQPLKADFYHGKLTGDINVSMQSTPPVLHMKGDLNDIDIASLLTVLSGKTPKLQIDARGNLFLEVTTKGKKTEELLKQVNGASRFNLSQGILKGVNIGFYVDTATALINKESLPSPAKLDQTEFGTLTGTAVIKNGVAYCDDLVLDSPLYITKGTGSIDLVNKTINYHLQVTAKPEQNKSKVLALYGKTVPISITGDLNNPSVNLDTLALMQEVGKEQLQKVSEKLGKALPDNANKFLQKLFH